MAYQLIYLKRFRSTKGSHFVVSFTIYPTYNTAILVLNVASHNITHSNHIPKHIAPRLVAVTRFGNTYYSGQGESAGPYRGQCVAEG
jgi:hypothetical protein